ncbi:MAG: tRNA (N(6)-L-threonylcarbamoyladenosine(37)-C(2))-methylthiotransferase MtaB [Thermodesulfovibrionia bacterium]|nr:tRNA (N(6)-L-threonylcarbamoyladenosine(37)-C(2))-methylthiotransferase MtaB [Thermodesulfovibrionia bacterium]
MRVAITTLGCKVNQSESALIRGSLKENGHEIVPMFQDTDNLGTSRFRPDVCIINTCSVTAKSDYQSRQMIRRAFKTGAKVIATGCYAQLRPLDLSNIKGIDLIVGNSQKNKLHEYLNTLYSDNFRSQNNGKTPVLIDSMDAPVKCGPYSSNRARAFLKIQDGCNFSCSYCIVPRARGKSRSLIPEAVLQAVGDFRSKGFKEIVLTGIHIGSYGLDLKPQTSLLEIVEKTVRTYPELRLRLSSIEPQELKKELLVLIKQGSVCPHLHIPLQSGSDRILKAMNRGYTTSFYKNLVTEIVSECPDISIGTDVIAGFPGEDDQEFENTLRFIEELPLSYMHVFPYSDRPDTKASALEGKVKKAVKKQRVRKLLEISKKKKYDYISKHLDSCLDVIVEQKHITTGFYRAISSNYMRLLVKSHNLLIGQRLPVRAITYTDGELIGIPL